jgi:hypothetical protein
MTVKEVAGKLGCSPETVKAHIRELFPGLMQNGKATYLNEKQVTVILEKMKRPVSSGTVVNLQSQIAGIDTTKSRVFRVDLLHRQIEAEMQNEINELRADLAVITRLLEYRTAGLEFYQDAAEAAGLTITDRDDLYSAYRGRR